MNIMDLIKEEEIAAFENYVDTYATGHFGERKVSGEYLLRFWDAAKSKYLIDLFGGKDLVLSKTISIEKSSEQLYDEMLDMCYEDDFYVYFLDSLKNKIYEKMSFMPKGELKDKYIDSWQFLIYATTPTALVSGIYNGETLSFITEDESEIKIQQGSKIIRTLGKIAKSYNADMADFEDFRIKVSQVLNQKKLTGKFCLSIHPLDYVTMSDNDSNWDSCMSWKNRGCYRQGTIEMMNSPMVVVAYLASSIPMKVGNIEWSNKKWRELFVINEDIITNIKSYPYCNMNLTQIALDWLKELADANLENKGFVFKEKWNNYFPYEQCHVAQNCNVVVEPCTGVMYNDFDNEPYENRAYFSTNLEDGMFVEFNYSGKSECMGCGEEGFVNREEELMFESCCDKHYTCCHCEVAYPSTEDLISVATPTNRYVCKECLSTHYQKDTIDGKYYPITSLIKIHLRSKELLNKESSKSIFV